MFNVEYSVVVAFHAYFHDSLLYLCIRGALNYKSNSSYVYETANTTIPMLKTEKSVAF